MLASLACFTFNALLIKHLSSVRLVSPWLTMSVRFAVGLLVTSVMFVPSGGTNLRRCFTGWLLASRGIMGAVATAAYYCTVGPLGAGKATFIGNTWCVWGALLAVFTLRERLRWSRAAGIAMAVGGLYLLMDLSPASLSHDGRWEVVSLGGSVLAAMVVVVIRQLTRTETSATIFASQCVYGLLLAIPFSLDGAANLHSTDWLLVVVAAACAATGQLAMTEGFRFLPVAVGGGFQIALPLVISIGGVLFFKEAFTVAQAWGGALILAGSFQTVVGVNWRSRGQVNIVLDKHD